MNLFHKLFCATLVLSGSVAYAAPPQNEPKADAVMTVVDGNVRFTVLTPQLIRMEWSEDGAFEDRATLTFVNRKMPAVPFKVHKSRSRLTVKTDKVTLTYVKNGKFSAENLKAEFMLNGKKVVWHYGDKDSLNLMGTTRTLDRADGWKLKRGPMETGILSRGGWTVVDDSERHVLAKTDSHWGEWVECRHAGNRQDLYLFAYGHDYMKALQDYVAVAGRIPLPPKYAFGYWWSRFWQYSDNELRDLVTQMRSMDIPIDVLIIDMDWHETWGLRSNNTAKDEYGQRIGWTGYTWKEQLFPSPKNLMTWCHDNHIKTSLNLHPASGIQPNEKPYDAFAKAYGWTENGKSIPFHIDEEKWADTYFDVVLAPMERDGVDFWWLDWQQWKKSKYTKGLSNTFWLNHTFMKHMAQSGDNHRPMIYHRWGGLGSHRYQVGFSGDTYTSWETLGFLPWFTSTASNVGYGYWGHDIGGHMKRDSEKGKTTDAELYTRWLQYGVFTPIFKTHCTKDHTIERRIWQFPNHMFYMRDAIRLRYTLAPYIYNAARQTYDTGVSMCRPMYYYYPECNEAYDNKEQYMFGDDLLVTAITTPADKVTGLAPRTVWFPDGKWFDCTTGALIEGGKTLTLDYTIAENPYYAKAGAIIPMNPLSVQNLQEPCSTLVLTFIPGADGKLSLYEDDGISKNYADTFATTAIEKRTDGNRIRVVISPRKGTYPDAPASRNYELRFPAQFPPKSVTVNGKAIDYARYAKAGEWRYDGYTLAPIIKTGDVPCNKECVVELTFDEADMAAQPRLYGKQGIFDRLVVLTSEFKHDFSANYDSLEMLPDEYLNVSQTPNFITEFPNEIGKWLDRYDRNIDKFLPVLIEKKCLSDDFITRLKAQLIDNKH